MTTTFDKSSIDETLNDYWQLLAPRQKQSVLAMFRTFFDTEENLDETFLTDYNTDISEALQEYNKGEYITNEEVEKKYRVSHV